MSLTAGCPDRYTNAWHCGGLWCLCNCSTRSVFGSLSLVLFLRLHMTSTLYVVIYFCFVFDMISYLISAVNKHTIQYNTTGRPWDKFLRAKRGKSRVSVSSRHDLESG